MVRGEPGAAKAFGNKHRECLGCHLAGWAGKSWVTPERNQRDVIPSESAELASRVRPLDAPELTLCVCVSGSRDQGRSEGHTALMVFGGTESEV